MALRRTVLQLVRDRLAVEPDERPPAKDLCKALTSFVLAGSATTQAQINHG